MLAEYLLDDIEHPGGLLSLDGGVDGAKEREKRMSW